MCVFCKIVEGEIPSFKLYEDEDVIAILDIAQVTKGHTLVLPKKHFNDILDVDKETLDKLIEVTQMLTIKLKNALNATGINILNNTGASAGQSVDHIHFHIIPRYDETDALVCEFKESGIKAEQVYNELKDLL